MIKQIIISIVAICALFSCYKSRSIPKQIMDSVVAVDASSGIVVYSDKSKSLILTASHVIESEMNAAACCGCENYDIDIKFLHTDYDGDFPIAVVEQYKVINVEANNISDLAIIEIHPQKILPHSDIARNSPELGDNIWLGANPNFNYRSLKRGMVSALGRMVDYLPHIEVSGGVIFGSSGGGAFNDDGKLFGVIQSVDMWRSKFCGPIFDNDGNIVDFTCFAMPLTDIGYISETYFIRSFLLHGSYSKYFNYLK